MAQIRNFDQVLFRKSFSNSGGKEVIAIPNLIALQKNLTTDFYRQKFHTSNVKMLVSNRSFTRFFRFPIRLIELRSNFLVTHLASQNTKRKNVFLQAEPFRHLFMLSFA